MTMETVNHHRSESPPRTLMVCFELYGQHEGWQDRLGYHDEGQVTRGGSERRDREAGREEAKQ